MLPFSLFIFIYFATLLPSPFAIAQLTTCSGIVPMNYRNDKISITDFGGIGDGRTLNTKAFRAAIYRIQHLKRRGGTLLYIPPGVYLTESFNLTSHMTLYLAKDAVIKAVQGSSNWPVVAPLPSYGRGRERPGGRYVSFIHGDGVHDVVITGENGTIDGQGDAWWNMWRTGTLKFTRPNLVEFINSYDIIISNVRFLNSPFWNIHPVYCSSYDITIRRVSGSSPFAGVAVGSETSGGVANVLAEHLNFYDMGIGINIKTNIGRGGFIKNITVSNVYMERSRKGLKIAGDTGDHPDDKFDPNALPIVKDITIKNVWGVNVQQAGSIYGLRNSPFTGICLSNIHLRGATRPRSVPWTCSYVSGAALLVSPWPCSALTSTQQDDSCSANL
ncbi:putative polygalacturonase, partial [Cucurbita argyrosperma subsp. sororia]